MLRLNQTRQAYLGATRTYPLERGRMFALHMFLGLILALAVLAPWIAPLMYWLADG